MSRDDGFDVADVATGLYDDPKVKALWRALGDQGRMSHALALHMATLLASWRHGRRVSVLEAVPVWLVPDAELIAALQTARLLDATGKLPARSWRGWFGPAYGRRELRREAGRIGGMASGRTRRSTPERLLQHPSTVAEPDRPTGRSVRTVRTDRPNRATEAQARGGPTKLSDAMAASGGFAAELVKP